MGPRRSASRLLVARATQSQLAISHQNFSSLPTLLDAGDVLVINNTQVLPSRLFVTTALGREIECLLLGKLESVTGEERWEILAKPMRLLNVGERLAARGREFADVVGRGGGGDTIVLRALEPGSIEMTMKECGLMPIPPYIRGGKSDSDDLESYQTVFASTPGSVAAPTASLHFTPEMFEQLAAKEVRVCELTLHLGAASFLPVERRFEREADRFWQESFSIPKRTMSELLAAKDERRRVIAVGTSVVRALETAFGEDRSSAIAADQLHFTKLFIKPGFSFRMVDALITNFHQPGSSHLMLVAAFIGEENVRRIYTEAIAKEYRFLSYGDSSILFRDF